MILSSPVFTYRFPLTISRSNMPDSVDEFVAEVSKCGRVTIPPEFQAGLGIDSVEAVRFCRTDSNELLLRPVDSATDLRGILEDTTDAEGRSALELLRTSRSAESDPTNET